VRLNISFEIGGNIVVRQGKVFEMGLRLKCKDKMVYSSPKEAYEIGFVRL